MYDLDIPNYYSGEYPQPTTIGIGTGYREPMMMISISGKQIRVLILEQT